MVSSGTTRNSLVDLGVLNEQHRQRIIIVRTIRPQGGTTDAAGEWLPSAARAEWLKASLALAMAAGLLLSLRLWLSQRDFPLTPVFSWLPPIPAPCGWIWLGALLLLLGLIVAWPRPRILIAVLVGLGTLLCLWDQSRWQPWMYQYLFMFGVLAASWWKPLPLPTDATETALNSCRLIMVATYFWSGLQKLNASFARIVFPWLLQPLTRQPAEDAGAIIACAGLAAALLETLLGVGLVTRRFRNVAVVLTVSMHVLILLSIGPLGQNWNVVVWPWNLAMIACVVILFWRTSTTPRAIFPAGGHRLHLAVLLFFGLLPVLSFFELWDDYLSASLYSGTTLRGSLDMNGSAYRTLPESVLQDVRRTKSGRYVLDLTDWSIRETNVPMYPARRVMRHVAEMVAARSKGHGDLILVIEKRPAWLTGHRKKTRVRISAPD